MELANHTISKRFNIIEEKLERLIEQRGRLGLVKIHSLPDPAYDLAAPLDVSLEYDGGEWLAVLPELEIYGDGLTEGEAIEDLKSELLDLYEDLNSIPAQKLGLGLLAKKRIVNKIVRKTKTR